jgi:hypothetical protein
MLPLTWPAYRRTAAGRRSAGARDKDWDRMADVTMDIASNGSLQTAERDVLVISESPPLTPFKRISNSLSGQL